MDFVTQTMLGAVTGHAVMGSRLGRVALLLGAAGGALPDLDVLLSGLSDSAVPSSLHRHFTHALVFVPIGGALAVTPWLLWRRLRNRWRLAIAATTAGCASHAVLDCCTSYGTHYLWPFTNARLSWDIVSIIDPIVSLPLLLALVVAAIAGAPRWSRAAALWCLIYLGVGFVQHERAAAVQRQLAVARGHEPQRARVMPTLGNTVVWRAVYEHEGRLHADAIRVPYLGRPTVRTGSSVERVTRDDLPESIRANPRLIGLFDQFAHFADGWVVRADDAFGTYGDARYSFDPSGFEPLWGVRLRPGRTPDAVPWGPDRARLDPGARWRTITRGDATFTPLSTVMETR